MSQTLLIESIQLDGEDKRVEVVISNPPGRRIYLQEGSTVTIDGNLILVMDPVVEGTHYDFDESVRISDAAAAAWPRREGS